MRPTGPAPTIITSASFLVVVTAIFAETPQERTRRVLKYGKARYVAKKLGDVYGGKEVFLRRVFFRSGNVEVWGGSYMPSKCHSQDK